MCAKNWNPIDRGSQRTQKKGVEEEEEAVAVAEKRSRRAQPTIKSQSELGGPNGRHSVFAEWLWAVWTGRLIRSAAEISSASLGNARRNPKNVCVSLLFQFLLQKS